jgi:hypothetical protein
MFETTYATRPPTEPDTSAAPPDGQPLRSIEGPLQTGWRECTLTRVKEIEALCDEVLARSQTPETLRFAGAIAVHLEAVREAAKAPRFHLWNPWRRGCYRDAAMRERAMSNLGAAEAEFLKIATGQYILGQIPSLLEHVRSHLVASDPRRLEFERIAKLLGVTDADGLNDPKNDDPATQIEVLALVELKRERIAAITRAASSAALREQVRLRNFRDVVVGTTIVMWILVIGLAILGAIAPALIPLCFAPEADARAIVVCPTEQSAMFSTNRTTDETARDIDVQTAATANSPDLAIVEMVGIIAATVAAVLSIRKLRGSSERYHLPLATTLLKLPTGAITAFVGLLLMRGQFIPGLTSLDTSAQILAWAFLFGYSQQLFTQYVDRQGQAVMNSVRGADLPKSTPDPGPRPAG